MPMVMMYCTLACLFSGIPKDIFRLGAVAKCFSKGTGYFLLVLDRSLFTTQSRQVVGWLVGMWYLTRSSVMGCAWYGIWSGYDILSCGDWVMTRSPGMRFFVQCVRYFACLQQGLSSFEYGMFLTILYWGVQPGICRVEGYGIWRKILLMIRR